MGRYDYVSGAISPYDAGMSLHTHAILDTSANPTCVNDRQL